MNIGFVAAILVQAIVIVVMVWWILKKNSPGQTQDKQSMALIQQQIDNLRQQISTSLSTNTADISRNLTSVMDVVNRQMESVTGNIVKNVNEQMGNVTQQLAKSNDSVGKRLDNAASVVGAVQKELGSLGQATERVFEVGRDIATLQEILKAPKLRGNLGEMFLNDMLKQILPVEHYEFQYKFKSGEAVDAIVKLAAGMIGIDSKFPLENFKKMLEAKTDDEKKRARKIFASDVKKHVDAIHNKYILPEEGTLDMALMYIPAENVYYEIITKDNNEDVGISEYALSNRVIPVSPNTLYAYLQAILIGLKGLEIETHAKEILNTIQQMQGDIAKFAEDYEVLGKHIGSARAKYDEGGKKLTKMTDRIENISQTQKE